MTFEFDDVIRQAKAIVHPKETVNEMKKLEQENGLLRLQLAQTNEYGDHWQEIAQAETVKLEQLRAENAELRDAIGDANLVMSLVGVHSAKVWQKQYAAVLRSGK